jgi:hypothetical protein
MAWKSRLHCRRRFPVGSYGGIVRPLS